MDSDGRPERAICVVSDITKIMDAARHADFHEKRLGLLALASGGRRWTARGDGKIIDAPDLEGGRSEGTAASRRRGWLDQTHPEDRAKIIAAWDKSVSEKAPFRIEHRIRQPNGTYRWNRSRAMPLVAANGEILEWVGSTIDIQDNVPLVDSLQDISRLTGSQIRAARGIINWSVKDLAERANVSTAVLRRMEAFDGLPSDLSSAASQIKTALQDAGVEFLSFPHGHPSVRLR